MGMKPEKRSAETFAGPDPQLGLYGPVAQLPVVGKRPRVVGTREIERRPASEPDLQREVAGRRRPIEGVGLHGKHGTAEVERFRPLLSGSETDLCDTEACRTENPE